MRWVVKVKEYLGAKIFNPLTTAALALASSASMLASSARASAMGFIGDGPGRVVPMYGVPAYGVPVIMGPPVVKYGPPPTPPATVTPVGPGTGGMPFFDWSSSFPSWSFGDKLYASFPAPDLSNMAFPKLFGMLAFVAYASLLAAAICGIAMRGGGWYISNKLKK
jgi:hypothetical protein